MYALDHLMPANNASDKTILDGKEVMIKLQEHSHATARRTERRSPSSVYSSSSFSWYSEDSCDRTCTKNHPRWKDDTHKRWHLINLVKMIFVIKKWFAFRCYKNRSRLKYRVKYSAPTVYSCLSASHLLTWRNPRHAWSTSLWVWWCRSIGWSSFPPSK